MSPKTGKEKEQIAPEFELGYRFDGRYENLEVLGSGSLGTAYKVRDIDSGETYVLKVLSTEVVKNQRIKNRFKKEIKQALELDHKNIAKTMDYGEEEGQVYFVTEFLKGHSLQRVIDYRSEDKRKFSIEEVVGIISEVGTALSYAHRTTVHGNLHPSNIFLFKDGVKVSDFCVSKTLKPAEFSALQIFQKEHYYYLAPEYDSEKLEVDERADIYSLGVLAYKLFTGKIPKGDFQRPSRINKELDPDIDFIIFRAMESNPDDRYQKVKDFLSDLTAVTGRVEIVKDPVSALGAIRGSKAKDKKKKYIGGSVEEKEDRFSIGAFAVAFVLIVLIAGLVFGRDLIIPKVKLASQYLAVMVEELRAPSDEADFKKALEQEEVLFTLEEKKQLWERFLAQHPEGSVRDKAEARLKEISTQVAQEEQERQAKEFAVFRSILGKLDTNEEKLAYAKRYHKRHQNNPYASDVEKIIEDISGHKVATQPPVAKIKETPEPKATTPSAKTPSKLKATVASSSPKASKKAAPKPKRSGGGTTSGSGSGSKQTLVASLAPVATPAPSRGLCLSDMVHVSGGNFIFGSDPNDALRSFLESEPIQVRIHDFCVDRYEYPNIASAYPLTEVSWHQADQICRNEGKRLCTELEWEKACKGNENSRYPYGMAYNQNLCNTESASGQDNKLSRSGAMPTCVSDYGIFDMSGNAGEWTASLLEPGKEDRIERGGSADRPGWAGRCSQRDNSHPSSRSPYVGFRCCKSIR